LSIVVNWFQEPKQRMGSNCKEVIQ